MANHRAEQIVVAVLAKVTGLTTTGARAFRGRLYPLQASDLPAVLVYMGADTDPIVHSQSLRDSTIEIGLDAVVQSVTTQIDTLLNQVRKEIIIALAADYTQGLGFVLDSTEGDADEPDLSGAADQPIGRMRLRWRIRYRRSRTDPSA